MSNPHLPEEMLDGIVDHLRGIKSALINCSLVSKSWIPRARRHLFVDIRFYTTKRLRSWKETFPDLSSSPACYAKTLAIDCLQVVTAADAEEGGWITGFSHVVHLEVACRAVRPDPEQPKICLVPFHGFSPAIKSLRVTVPALSSLRVFDLIFSFPLLEDLSVVIPYEPLTGDGDGSRGDEIPPASQRSSLPAFTGSLELYLQGGMKPFTRRLLSLPGGIHFPKLTWMWFREEDLPILMALVEECSHTLESLDISDARGTPIRPCTRIHSLSSFIVGSGLASIDLSKATKLKDMTFRCRRLNVGWVVMALRTFTPNHRNLQQISLYPPHTPPGFAIGETTYMQWMELDHRFTQLWESHSIRPKVLYQAPPGKEGEATRDRMFSLLPEVTSRGIVDLVRRKR
jgi:hypothetical protein